MIITGPTVWTWASAFAFMLMAITSAFMFAFNIYPEVAADILQFQSQIILVVVGYIFGERQNK